MNDTEKTKVVEALEQAKNIAIVPSKVAGSDAFAAGAGLYLMLKQKEKQVSFLYPGKIPDECVGVLKDDEILSDVAQRELKVSIDYSNTPASKVQYYTENDVLYLSISPISKGFDLKRIQADLKGFDYDLILTVGAQGLDDFGQSFTDLQDEFTKAKIINIDNTERNTRYGNVNIVDPQESSLSLLALNRAVNWGLKVDARSAKALLTGISYRNLATKS
jgi:nanoRNase/pAp phosphatase (c-di-AMP/oligoRNAs hydrolase)